MICLSYIYFIITFFLFYSFYIKIIEKSMQKVSLEYIYIMINLKNLKAYRFKKTCSIKYIFLDTLTSR